MESKRSKVAIIGGGPSGCMCAYFASKGCDVVIFDASIPLKTLLYTGGGRCNLAYCEYDFRELTKFYPRGDKFLYSIFSQFSTSDTIDFFNKIGVETYVQDNLRIFPTSNSAIEVREKFLKALEKIQIKQEKVLKIEKSFKLTTDLGFYTFDKVVIATGGRSNGHKLAQSLGHKIETLKPALVGLVSLENLKTLAGISLPNISAQVEFNGKNVYNVFDDLLFTHVGISGPLAFKISSMCAKLDYNLANPLKVTLNFLNKEINLQEILNSNPKKDIKNIISEFIPQKFTLELLKRANIPADLKCSQIDGKTRDLIMQNLTAFKLTITSPTKDGETVTAGGVCLDEINPKTMQSKLVEGLYFCGEIIDVDGLCGGFNLQNCWSTGYIVGNNLPN